MPESTTQYQSIQHLKKLGWKVVRNKVVSPSGWMDATAYKNGLTVFIEFKSEGVKARKIQNYQREQMIENGFIALVIDEKDKLIRIFDFIESTLFKHLKQSPTVTNLIEIINES